MKKFLLPTVSVMSLISLVLNFILLDKVSDLQDTPPTISVETLREVVDEETPDYDFQFDQLVGRLDTLESAVDE